jgi:hypothetical protein
MANTFEAIATVTVGSGGVANIEFTNIPATYTDLVVKTSLRNADPTNSRWNVKITFNGNGSNYSERLLFGAGSSAGSDVRSNTTPFAYFYGCMNGNTVSTFSNGEFYIPNYASANHKSVSFDSVTENNSATDQILALNAGLWANSAAITSIKLEDNNNVYNISQYSTATLYGIKNS